MEKASHLKTNVINYSEGLKQVDIRIVSLRTK
jgi:hypothetical protein